MKVNIYALNQFKRFANRWCISQSGKQYWIKQLAASAMILEKDKAQSLLKLMLMKLVYIFN